MQKYLIVSLCIIATFLSIEARPWYEDTGYGDEDSDDEFSEHGHSVQAFDLGYRSDTAYGNRLASNSRRLGGYSSNSYDNSRSRGNGDVSRGYGNNGYGSSGYGDNGYGSNGYDGNGYEANGYEGSRYEGNGYEGNGYEGNAYEGNGYEGNGYEGKGYEGSRYEGNGYEGNGYEGNGYEGNAYEGNGYESNGYEGNGNEGNGYGNNGYGYNGNGASVRRSHGRSNFDNGGFVPRSCPHCKINSFGNGDNNRNTFNLPKEAYY